MLNFHTVKDTFEYEFGQVEFQKITILNFLKSSSRHKKTEAIPLVENFLTHRIYCLIHL